MVARDCSWSTVIVVSPTRVTVSPVVASSDCQSKTLVVASTTCGWSGVPPLGRAPVGLGVGLPAVSLAWVGSGVPELVVSTDPGSSSPSVQPVRANMRANASAIVGEVATSAIRAARHQTPMLCIECAWLPR